MRLKPRVKIFGIRPELNLALMIANDAYAQFNREMTVTSLVDGVHSRTSLHYSGCAADLRTRDLPDRIKTRIFERIKESLNDEFDVVLEQTHIHIEFQPKREAR